MPNVLTMLSTVTCGHPPDTPGKVQTQSEAKLKVNGSSVLLQTSINGQQIGLPVGLPDCGIQPTAGSEKCRMVSEVSAGAALKLKVNRDPVMLDTTLKGSTNGKIEGVRAEVAGGRGKPVETPDSVAGGTDELRVLWAWNRFPAAD